MGSITKKLTYLTKVVRFLPHIILYNSHPKKDFLEQERNIWIKTIKHEEIYNFNNFIWLLDNLPEYRSVLYWRLGKFISFLSIVAKRRESLYINMHSDKIGAGLVMQHGFSTIIEAVRIGKECQIWHNVTIGTNISNTGNKATIGDNVKICTGSMVLGRITIGDNVTIGAGCVVVKDVPSNCVVVGNPATIVKLNGEKVNIRL